MSTYFGLWKINLKTTESKLNDIYRIIWECSYRMGGFPEEKSVLDPHIIRIFPGGPDFSLKHLRFLGGVKFFSHTNLNL